MADENNVNLGGSANGGDGNVNQNPTNNNAGDGQSATGGTNNPSGGVQTKMYDVVVNGVKKQVPESDLIANYQKGMAADEKFNEAAKIKKDAEPFIKAIQNFNAIVSKKDYKSAVKVLGQDFVDGLIKERGASVQGNTNTNYSPEDVAIAKYFGITPDEYLEGKNKALGLDNPLVNKLMREVEELKTQIKSGTGEKPVTELVASQVESKDIENKFLALTSKYPKINPHDVLTVVEKGNYGPESFEKIFEALQKKQDADIDKMIEERMEQKKKNANKLVSGNSSSGDVDFSNLSGKSSKEKMDALIKILD